MIMKAIILAAALSGSILGGCIGDKATKSCPCSCEKCGDKCECCPGCKDACSCPECPNHRH